MSISRGTDRIIEEMRPTKCKLHSIENEEDPLKGREKCKRFVSSFQNDDYRHLKTKNATQSLF